MNLSLYPPRGRFLLLRQSSNQKQKATQVAAKARPKNRVSKATQLARRYRSLLKHSSSQNLGHPISRPAPEWGIGAISWYVHF